MGPCGVQVVDDKGVGVPVAAIRDALGQVRMVGRWPCARVNRLTMAASEAWR